MFERLFIHFFIPIFAAGAATLASTPAFAAVKAAEWRDKRIKGTDRWLNKRDQINQSTFLLPSLNLSLSLSLLSLVTSRRPGERGTIYSARLAL